MHKKLKIILIIVISTIIIGSSICSYLIKNEEMRKTTHYTYELQFVPQSFNQTFIIEVPILVPLSERDTILDFESKFLNNLKILTGTIENITINTTDYGKTLFVQSNTEIKIKSEFDAKYDLHKVYVFSTREKNTGFAGYNGNYWVYYQSTQENNASLKLSYSWGEKYFNSNGSINDNLYPNGWQLTEGTEMHTIV